MPHPVSGWDKVSENLGVTVVVPVAPVVTSHNLQSGFENVIQKYLTSCKLATEM